MARRESVVGGSRDERLIGRALDMDERSSDLLRKAVYADVNPPGATRLTDQAMQRRRLEELEPTGLSRLELDKLEEFRANRVGEVQ